MAFRTNKVPVLQEKSASGAVATFNTALAMPLVNGEFTIEAYQEGSGNPSPVNVRNIVPRHEVNICNVSDFATWFRGIYLGLYSFIDLGTLTWNIYDGDKFYTTISDLKSPVTTSERTEGMVCPIYKPSSTYTIGQMSDKSFLKFNQTENFWIRDSAYSDAQSFKTAMSGVYLIYELATPTTPTITEAQFNALLSSFNINGAHYLVNLGEDTYGAVYNSATGKKENTYNCDTFDLSDYTYIAPVGDSFTRRNYALSRDAIANTNQICNIATYAYNLDGYLHFYCRNKVLYLILPNEVTEATIQVKYQVGATETQLEPTPINTFNGANNNIFCDTGDTSLTYKDLDIAKRGNFREVFRLPS